MSGFPKFNSPISDSNSPKAMEVDEGDLSLICDSLTIQTPPAYHPTPATDSTMSPISPLDPSFSSLPFVPRSMPKSESSAVTRSIRSLTSWVSAVDEQTMRRIALVPHMMSGYVQLLFNIAIPTVFLYWVYSFGCTIQSDVEKKVQLFSEEVMEQIAKCSRDYRENRCDPSTRVPALISACQAWEECMGRDPHLVAKRSGISAEIFGQTLNSFFNVLSWKSIASIVLLVVGVCVVFNLSFSMSRKGPDHRSGVLERDVPRHGKHGQLTNGGTPVLVSRRRKF